MNNTCEECYADFDFLVPEQDICPICGVPFDGEDEDEEKTDEEGM
jgi:hypothetical protein